MFLIARDFLTVVGVFLTLLLIFRLEAGSIQERTYVEQEAMQAAQMIYTDPSQGRSGGPAAY